MKSLFIYAFVAASLFPPTGAFCVESTGDIAFEYGYAECCAAEDAALQISSREPGDCDGCRDLTISTSSISAQRLSLLVMSSPAATPGSPPVIGGGSSAGPRSAFASPVAPAHLRHLSSTVIRR